MSKRKDTRKFEDKADEKQKKRARQVKVLGKRSGRLGEGQKRHALTHTRSCPSTRKRVMAPSSAVEKSGRRGAALLLHVERGETRRRQRADVERPNFAWRPAPATPSPYSASEGREYVGALAKLERKTKDTAERNQRGEGAGEAESSASGGRQATVTCAAAAAVTSSTDRKQCKSAACATTAGAHHDGFSTAATPLRHSFDP